jgi:DNA polymerase III delta prime subunit
MEIYEHITDTKSWINKYRPKIASDVLGIELQKECILNWLRDFEKNAIEMKSSDKKKKIKIKIDPVDDDVELNFDEKIEKKNIKHGTDQKKPTLLLTGNHGVGKTSMITAILSEKKYMIKIIDFNKINTIKDIEQYVEKILIGKSLEYFISGKNPPKTAIIIDEIESIISTNEKKFALTILKTNSLHWCCPIIFISNNNHNKTINIIRNYSYEIKIPQPIHKTMLDMLVKICVNEKIKISEHTVADKIIEQSQHDFRKLISFLQNIKELYPHTIFSDLEFRELGTLIKKKDIDHSIFDATSKLMYSFKDMSEALKLFETEKVLMPLMIQQNYVTALCNKNIRDAYVYKDIATSLSDGDTIENYIYGDQNWDLKEIHGFLSCVYPSYQLSKELNKKTNTFIPHLDFPVDLNRTSIKKINKKQIGKLRKCFKCLDIEDYIYMNRIIKTLFETDDIELCNELLNGYNCTLNNIESVLKIDKIEDGKYAIPANIKKRLKYIDEISSSSDIDYCDD